MTYGAYIHVPFCRGKCDYCSFYSIPCPSDSHNAESLFDAYLHTLLEDIASGVHFHAMSVDTIYFGGGTPSVFGHERILAVLRALRELFKIMPDAEISIECNPSDISDDALLPLIEAGVNRVTVGIQTFNEKLRKIIGRFPLPAEYDLLEKFMNLTGVAHGIDLMAGIPGATEKDLQNDLNTIISLKPEHISVYLLTIENGTPLASRVANDEEFHNFQRRCLSYTIDFLAKAGYRHYEISNHCFPGFESKHNLKYWKFQPYLGFGSGAHGFTGNKRYFNSQEVEEYIRMPRYIEDIRSKNAAMAEFLMTALRLMEGFSENSFFEVFGVKVPHQVEYSLEKLADEKLIQIFHEGNSSRYALTDEGIFVSDYVIYRCVESLL